MRENSWRLVGLRCGMSVWRISPNWRLRTSNSVARSRKPENDSLENPEHLEGPFSAKLTRRSLLSDSLMNGVASPARLARFPSCEYF